MLTINFGEETYGASIRGCQNICNTSGLFLETPFKQIHTGKDVFVHFEVQKNAPGSGFPYIAFACRYQDFCLFLSLVTGVVTTFPFDSRSVHTSHLFLLL